MRLSGILAILFFAVMLLPPGGARADDQCSGHNLLPTPRAATSCTTIKPQPFVSPDKKNIASVYPDDISLNTSPDTESRIVIRTSAGNTTTSKSYASARGDNGYYVVSAQWSPDSLYFVYSLSSSGGHSPWSFPIWVYGLKENQFVSFSELINGNPTIASDFKFTAPHTLVATTWKQSGDMNDKVPVTVDLEAAIAKLKAAPK